MINWIWLTLMLSAVVVGAFSGNMEAVSKASIDSAKSAVTLAIGLVGVMSFWLGMMKVAQDAGLLDYLAKKLKPLMRWLFPEVPANHPAMSAMIMNMSSNMLGLGNAATPFGIKAMVELNRLNKQPGTITNAMALFLAINTSNVTILPLGVIALRAAAGSTAPGSIFITTLIATSVSTVTAVLITKFLQRLPAYGTDPGALVEDKTNTTTETQEVVHENRTQIAKPLRQGILVLFLVGMTVAVIVHVLRAEGSMLTALKDIFQNWLLVLLIGGILVYGFINEVKVYESLVSGAKRGFQTSIKIIPYLAAILVAVGMFRASGALQWLIHFLSPITGFIGMPAETLPMAILRPLSGSGAYGVLAETITTYGPDSLVGQIVSTMQGSCETTFYVLAVYCGAVAIKNMRHTVLACLISDAAGLLTAVYVCRLFFT